MTQSELSPSPASDAMITHYGLFWSERDVCWEGVKGQPGRLLGREKEPLGRKGAPTKAERDNSRDYRSFLGIYCLYGDGELLYVGEAGLDTNRTLYDRLKQHRKGPMSGRWDRFSWFGREKCEGNASIKASLGQLEAVAIAIINPGFNKQSGTFSGATQVYQIPDDKAEGDLETKLERLAATLKEIKMGQKSVS